jgi:peptide chain release factor 2
MADAEHTAEQKIAELEARMNAPDFWADKTLAQAVIKELQDLKLQKEIGGKGGPYDAGNAVVTILSGAGGDDAEDFSGMLFGMYRKFAEKRGWQSSIIHQNENDHGGFRNLSFDVIGRGAYGTLKHESGVHRLVRISPFNAKKLRHTSFSLVEVIPKFEKEAAVQIRPEDIKVEFAKAGGPGGQNVNKRETAVRIVHIPTNLSVHVASERSQAQNRERALQILKGKLYKRAEEERLAKEKGMQISTTTEIEWGSQIRSYVLHPYKMVKDHRTDVEVHDPDRVLNGDLDKFIEAEKGL